MGKNDGFLLYERKNNGDIPPLKRIENFKEFHTYLDDEERRKQASRCMNCGVPMCQSAIKLAGMVTGCPLHLSLIHISEPTRQAETSYAVFCLKKKKKNKKKKKELLSNHDRAITRHQDR